jgi:hypothetical protein
MLVWVHTCSVVGPRVTLGADASEEVDGAIERGDRMANAVKASGERGSRRPPTRAVELPGVAEIPAAGRPTEEDNLIAYRSHLVPESGRWARDFSLHNLGAHNVRHAHNRSSRKSPLGSQWGLSQRGTLPTFSGPFLLIHLSSFRVTHPGARSACESGPIVTHPARRIDGASSQGAEHGEGRRTPTRSPCVGVVVRARVRERRAADRDQKGKSSSFAWSASAEAAASRTARL